MALPVREERPLDTHIVELHWDDRTAVAQAATLLLTVFAGDGRYSSERIDQELRPSPPPLQRQFFVAYRHGRLVGIGGAKSADWASNTHILYLSAVEPESRGHGIGRALIRARVDWVRGQNPHGRILVSTAKPKRYRDHGFRPVNRERIGDKHLMLLEY